MSTAYQSPVIGPEMAGTLMTPEEFDTAQDWDENYVYELINGVLIVAPPPSEGERGPNSLLDHLLRVYREQHRKGKSLDYTLPEHTVCTSGSRRRADHVIWAGLGRIPDVDDDVPAIVIEFVSRGKRDRRRDYEEKRDEYLALGIQEYWIIDRFRRRLTVFKPKGKSFEEIVVLEPKTYATPLLPGFKFPLAKILAEADMLAAAKKKGRGRRARG